MTLIPECPIQLNIASFHRYREMCGPASFWVSNNRVTGVWVTIFSRHLWVTLVGHLGESIWTFR